MARRPQKNNPELNVTSFCDIITVTIVALFMVMVIVIDLALRTPKLRPTPIDVKTTNQAVYVECRGGQLFFIDKVELANAMRTAARDLRARALSGEDGAMEAAMSQDVGNTYYRLDNSFMMMGVIALIPRAEAQGYAPPTEEDPGAFERLMTSMNTNTHYFFYLVRDDSFEAFKNVRDLSAQNGFINGWEYLGRDEAITFEGMFSRLKAE